MKESTGGVYLQLMENLSSLYDPVDLERLGGSFFRNPLIRPFSLVAQVLFDPIEFYSRLGLPKSGVGNQLFSCMSGEFTLLGPNHGVMLVVTAPGYEPCIPFFLITKGAFAALPVLFGLPGASVELHIQGGAARYTITLPPQRPFLARIRRFVVTPFRAPVLAGELQEASEVVVQRYGELQEAKKTIAQQARALETAHNISKRLHATFDLERALSVIVGALVELGGFSYARVELDGDARSAESPSASESPPAGVVHRPLEGRDRLLGQLYLVPKPDHTKEELDQLLSYVVPVVSLALEEAIAYAELEEYRDQLEKKVAVRTEELLEARDRLALTVTELRDAQAARDRFFANINHEIRNPLALIALASRRLGQSEAAKAPEATTLLQGIDLNVGRLLSLVDGLLLLATSSEAKLRLRRREQDVVALTRRLHTSFLPRAEHAGVALRMESPDSLRASVDEVAVERILANLLSNALKFTPAGGSAVLRVEEDEGGVSGQSHQT